MASPEPAAARDTALYATATAGGDGMSANPAYDIGDAGGLVEYEMVDELGGPVPSSYAAVKPNSPGRDAQGSAYDRLHTPQQANSQPHDGGVYAEADDAGAGTYDVIKMMPLDAAAYAVPAPVTSSATRPAGDTKARPASDYAVPVEPGRPAAAAGHAAGQNMYAEPSERPPEIKYTPTAGTDGPCMPHPGLPDYSVPTPLAPVYGTVDKLQSGARKLPGTIAADDADLYAQATTPAGDTCVKDADNNADNYVEHLPITAAPTPIVAADEGELAAIDGLPGSGGGGEPDRFVRKASVYAGFGAESNTDA